MPQYLDESAITGRTAEGAPASTSRRILDESEITGQAQPERNIFQRIGDFVSDSGEQKKFGRTLLEDATAVGNFALSGPGMGVSWLAGRARAAEQLLKGKDRRTALQEGMETEQRVGVALTPKGGMAAIDRVFGSELTPGDTKLEAAMESLSKGIHHYGEKVEVGTDRALLAEDVDAFFSGAMGVPFAKHSLKKLENTVKAVTGTLPKELPRTPSQLAVLLGTDVSKLRKGAPVESVATILRPEPVVVESPGQVKALFDTAKKNRPPEISDVAAVETLFAKARSKGLAQIGPKSPYEAIAESKSRIAEGKLLEESPKVEGEPLALPPELAPLNVALEKVKAGRAFDLTAEEKISLDHSVKVRDGQLLDHNGRPFEKGAVDPDLLKGILLAGGVAAYVAQNPEAAEAVAWISGGALAIKGKGGNWHPEAVKQIADPLHTVFGEAGPAWWSEMRPEVATSVEHWPDRAVSSYLNKHAGTATDPLKDVRLPDGTRWEDVTDKAFRGPPARNFQQYEVMQNESFNGYAAYDGTGKQVSKTFGEASDAYAWAKENKPKGFEQFKPDEPVWLQGQTRPFEALRSHLSHVGDYLRMNVKPEDLAKYDLVRAVKESAANDARVAKEMERAAAASTKDLPVYKDYGDGMKWVELKLPEELTPEQARTVRPVTEWGRDYGNTPANARFQALDAQGKPITNNYTQERAVGPTPQSAYLAGKLAEEGNAMGHCVGGYADEVASGATRILSLRDKKGQSHVTVELAKGTPKHEADAQGNLQMPPKLQADSILQIKGKQNRAPVDVYQPYVQDLVKSGTWGEVRDLQNTGGLVRDTTTGEYLTAAERRVAYDAAIKKYKDSERGSADPELLAKIAAGTAAGAYLLSSDNAEQGLAAMGLGLAMSMKGAPEAALLAAAREGGPKAQAAFTELYRQNVKQAERTLQSKFGRQNVDIEGALQDGMTSALAAVATGAFRGDSKFSTFLHTAVVNKALNQLEAQRVRPDTVSLTEDPATGRSGLAETLGHNETPANIALNKGLGQQIEAAMAKIDPRFREAFLAIEADGMSYEAAAEKFGVPVGTIRSRVSRAKEALQGQLREYRDGEVGFDEAIPNRATGTLGSREGGAADPKLLAALGVGGTTGLWLDRDNPLRGAALGALAGLGTRHAIFKQALDGLDLALGRGSTRVGHIDQQLRRGVRDMEHAASVEMSAASEKIHTFVKEAKKLSPERRDALEKAYLDSNVQGVAEAIKGNPALVEGYRQVRQFIDEIGDQLRGFERFGHGMTEHLPRVVKDYEGLIQKLGHEMRTTLEKVMLRAEADMLKRRGRQLTEVERSVILNNFMLKDPATSHLPGFAKARTIKMTDELRPFYHTMEESLIRYAHAAVEDVATARFFGKDLRTTKDGGKKFTNVDASIGALTDRAMQEGRITPEQAVELQAILRARFGQGERAPSGALQDVRNVTGLATLGQLGSGIVQTSEALLSAYHHGIKPAVEAAGILLTRRGIKPGEFGLANHLIEETISKRPTGVALSAVLKANLLATFDQLGMKQNLTASFLKNKYLSETAVGRAKLAEKWGEAYGEDFPALVKELQQSTVERRGPLVDSLLYGELSDIRPTSRFEMPQLYNEHPNGRFMWQLKQFMLTQADVLRRDAYDNIKTGEPAKVAKGLKNLTLYAAALGTATIPADAIKDWISGRPFDFTKIDYVENMARNFGLSRYSLDKVQRSPNPAKATLDVAKDMVKPPIVSVGERVATGFNEPKKLVPMVPLAGRPIYDRYLGGNEAAKIADMKAAKLRIRSEAEARDPGLKAARLLRERERKDRALRAARELR